MYKWDKKLVQEAMKYGFLPENPHVYLDESFTMQNLYDLRLMLLALMTDENVAKIRQQFQTKEKPPAASATPLKKKD
jgi:hypothetical protein